jgi:hypothetical protein
LSKDIQPELNYGEFKNGEEINLSFRKICADLSGTREKQKIKKQGISIVSYLKNKDKEFIRNQIISKIQDLHYNFKPTIKLHSTFLTLPSKELFTESNYIDNVKEQINNFLNERKKKCNQSLIILNYHEIRPGTWYDDQDHYPKPHDSDGTVIAIGNKSQIGNNDFVTLADQLVVHLKKYLPSFFDENFKRKFSTIWSTLGYFDHKDYKITPEFAKTFNEFKDEYRKNPLKIEVNKLRLVEFNYKDLRNAKPLGEFEL